MEYAAHWLEEVNLTEFANRSAGTLAYGQQRRLEIARCMMTRPRILMLDEPAAGLNPKETDDLKALIAKLRSEHNVTVLLIEHDMKLVMSISDHIVVINQGAPLADGTPEQIRDNPDVIKAYLGKREHAEFRQGFHLLRQDPGAARRQRGSEEGRDRHPDRRQRRRQVDPADDALRLAAGGQRQHPLRRRGTGRPALLHHHAQEHRGGPGRPPGSRPTVEENLAMGGFFTDKDDYQVQMDKVLELFPRLKERYEQRAGTMSGGEQQMLAIGRALMSKPKLLLLDEPSLGLAPIIIQQIFEIIEQLRREGVTVFLVEQNANQALKLADRAYVLENGRIVMHDTGAALLTNPKVRDAYLGG